MYLTDDTYSTTELQRAISLSPLSKPAIAAFVGFYKVAKDFLDTRIFLEIRRQIEQLIETRLNLRKSLDKAKMGRMLAVAELTHRRALPEGVEPLHLLAKTSEQLEMAFAEEEENAVSQAVSTPENSTTFKQLKQERDACLESLRQYEAFVRLLLVGRIFPPPLITNGLEEVPLLQVFGGARTLSELHQAYKTLRKAWHPDISPYAESETNARFYWLKQAYTTLINNWSRFDPQNQEIPATRIEKLKNQQLQWSPESFWYWQTCNAEVTV